HSLHYKSKELLSSQEQEHVANQKNITRGETVIECYPKDFYTFLFGVLIVTGAIVSVINFFRTGNTSMLMNLCYVAAGHTGIQKASSLFKGRLARQSHED
ncbi:MAG: hypothetical protein ACXWOL_15430, partial [Ktedonobacteraceae bacterium]